ncbi:MAG: succinylglutamate desuccinylase/aspartoacylase family protein [Thermoanaerobaculia bacterium]|nr:succinylglutamate desuccinylase/aspartoacylase family protein [Thermoanaerobaculia bacterium]
MSENPPLEKTSYTNEELHIGGERVAPGSRKRVEIPVARLFTGTWLSLPIWIVNGSEPGPTMFLDAAIHGDELNGMEIIRRVLDRLRPDRLRGSIIAVPVVNVFGFVQKDRYLPDRRDLNRSFPGSARGSTAGRLAHLLMTEVVDRCDYGIDFHTGSLDRTNLPQIRALLSDPETRKMAEAFGAPMMYEAKEIAGSLRGSARKRGVHTMVYEAGGPLRFDEAEIGMGVEGTLRVLAALEMIDLGVGDAPRSSFEAHRTRWQRASISGILYLEVSLGDRVVKDQPLGSIAQLFSGRRSRIHAPFDGLVIGATMTPLVHQGDALIHIAESV